MVLNIENSVSIYGNTQSTPDFIEKNAILDGVSDVHCLLIEHSMSYGLCQLTLTLLIIKVIHINTLVTRIGIDMTLAAILLNKGTR